jgi:DNA-binding transcriptional regulator YhcF (GntR family)
MTQRLEPDFRVEREHDVPLGTQLAWKLGGMITDGHIEPGERLPSVRKLAEAAGVNVNTVRAVYHRLENQGLLVSEQGRGTFAARPPRPGGPDGPPDREPEAAANAPALEPATNRELRRQIAALEAELVRHPQVAPKADDIGRASPTPKGNLLTTDELREIRDDLLARLEQLEAARTEVLQRLRELRAIEAASAPEGARVEEPRRHSTSSLGGARVRWVG